MIARVVSLKHFKGVLVGRDLSNILKEGHIYAITECLGELMLTDLGEHAEAKWLEGGRGTITQIMMDGTYCLTKDENKKQPKKR